MLQTYKVPASSMHCLFDRNAGVEVLPEPFRMQRNVCLQVALTEYRDYIVLTENDAFVRLCAERQTLLSLAISGSQSLYRYYLRDLAFAIVKELSVAESFNRDATIILPIASNVQMSGATGLADLSAYSADAKRGLLKDFMEAGFRYSEPKRERNKNLLNVATVLHKLSFSQKIPNVISLSYDFAS